jgi:hypothetical protein
VDEAASLALIALMAEQTLALVSKDAVGHFFITYG